MEFLVEDRMDRVFNDEFRMLDELGKLIEDSVLRSKLFPPNVYPSPSSLHLPSLPSFPLPSPPHLYSPP